MTTSIDQRLPRETRKGNPRSGLLAGRTSLRWVGMLTVVVRLLSRGHRLPSPFAARLQARSRETRHVATTASTAGVVQLDDRDDRCDDVRGRPRFSPC